MPYSPYLNIYCIPSELDIRGKSLLYPNSFRLDCFIKSSMIKSEVSASLRRFIDESTGHSLIYLSLGTVCCDELNIFIRLIRYLTKTNYRVIVSMGRTKGLHLPSNMWGDSYIPQKAIMPMIDLFITNGGMNSVTEALSEGNY